MVKVGYCYQIGKGRCGVLQIKKPCNNWLCSLYKHWDYYDDENTHVHKIVYIIYSQL